MTLLEQVIKASINPELSKEPLKYPIAFNADPIIQNLKPASENPDLFSVLQPLDGFQIAGADLKIIDSYSKFYANLKRLLKDPISFSYDLEPFLLMLNHLLEKIVVESLGPTDFDSAGTEADAGYTAMMLQKFGCLVPRHLICLLIEAFIVLDQWELVETLIANNLINCWSCPDLLHSLLVKKQSHLICLYLRHVSDIRALDFCGILKYFLSPSKDSVLKMKSVRVEWESEALSAISKARNEGLSGKTLELAKDASILLMMAYDCFSSPQLCLHFLLSFNVDEVIFSSAIGKLNSEEVLELIRYLSKWLKKYERFPQAVPCPMAETELRFKMCRWVPKLEHVVNCLGLVVDEHFASLALHSESHEELKVSKQIIDSLVLQGRLSCSVANVIQVLKPEVGGTQKTGNHMLARSTRSTKKLFNKRES